jgi:predicted amidohydrolase
MKIGLVQYNPAWEDKTYNKKQIENLLKSFNEKISLLIFPEMTLTGFTMQAKKFAELPDGESFKYFAGIAAKLNSDLMAGIIEEKEDNYYNTLIHISSSGELAASYRKMHPFSVSTENIYFQRGKKIVTSAVKNFKAGLSICYDLRFPELYRYYAKERVDILINIANWPVERIDHWRTLLKARAIENQCYSVGVNRTGNDPKLRYNGFSSVYDPSGNEIISVESREGIFITDISAENVRDIREKLPFLNDIHLI